MRCLECGAEFDEDERVPAGLPRCGSPPGMGAMTPRSGALLDRRCLCRRPGRTENRSWLDWMSRLARLWMPRYLQEAFWMTPRRFASDRTRHFRPSEASGCFSFPTERICEVSSECSKPLPPPGVRTDTLRVPNGFSNCSWTVRRSSAVF